MYEIEQSSTFVCHGGKDRPVPQGKRMADGKRAVPRFQVAHANLTCLPIILAQIAILNCAATILSTGWLRLSHSRRPDHRAAPAPCQRTTRAQRGALQRLSVDDGRTDGADDPVRLAGGISAVPEISANKYALNIRFMLPETVSRAAGRPRRM